MRAIGAHQSAWYAVVLGAQGLELHWLRHDGCALGAAAAAAVDLNFSRTFICPSFPWLHGHIRSGTTQVIIGTFDVDFAAARECGGRLTSSMPNAECRIVCAQCRRRIAQAEERDRIGQAVCCHFMIALLAALRRCRALAAQSQLWPRILHCVPRRSRTEADCAHAVNRVLYRSQGDVREQNKIMRHMAGSLAACRTCGCQCFYLVLYSMISSFAHSAHAAKPCAMEMPIF